MPDIRHLMPGVCDQTSHDRCLLADVLWQVSVIRHLMSGVFYQTSDDRCLLSDVWYQKSDVRCLLSDVSYQTSDGRCLLSDVWWQVPDIRRLMSDVWSQVFVIRHLISDIWCQVSVIRHLMSDVWWQVSDIRCLLSDVLCQVSDFRHLMSDVCCQTSDFRCLISDVWCQVSVIGRLISDVWWQMSDIRRLISGVWYQASLRSGINCVHCDNHFFIFILFPQFIYDLFQILLTKNIIILINAKKPMMAFFTLLTVNVCSCVPWNASIRWMTPPLADSKIILPSELNFTPVHSMLGSFWMWKVENGPYENRWKKKKKALRHERYSWLSLRRTPLGPALGCLS